MTIVSVVISAKCDICGSCQSMDAGDISTAASWDFQRFLRNIGWWTHGELADICPKHPRLMTTADTDSISDVLAANRSAFSDRAAGLLRERP